MYQPDQIANILHATPAGSPKVPLCTEHLLTDSRQITFPETSLFFALPGKRHDGHDHIVEAYDKGVRQFVVSREIAYNDFPGAVFFPVPDTLTALQQLAAHHRRQFNLPVIGITGSNGKTITKEWLYQLLYRDLHIVRSPRSYNSQVGVPLSVWLLNAEHDLAIFEAGISQPGEMARLADIIRPTIGLFTNIGPAHQESFDRYSQKLREKLELFRDVQHLIYCRDNPEVDREITQLGVPLFSWSMQQVADLRIISVEKRDGSSVISGSCRGESVQIRIPFSDAASIENAIHCWALLLCLNLTGQGVPHFPDLDPVAMRLELKEGINNCTLINDSYNSDLASLAIALRFLAQQRPGARHTLILSDILQSGEPDDVLYGKVTRLITQQKVDRVIGIGQAVQHLRSQLPATVEGQFFPDTASFLHQIDPSGFRDEAVLLKGARRFAFEDIAQRLARQLHLTTLEIDLNAVMHNLTAYTRRLNPGTQLMVMVKAAAYGSGSLDLARLLEFQKIACLAVAYADEGVELRRHGITLPILVLSPEEAVFESLVRYRLEPEIYSFALLKQFARYVEPEGNPFPVHIKIDTGMHRLGFLPSEAEALADALLRFPQLQVHTIFSHLAASEAPAHDAFTQQQADLFFSTCDRLTARLGYRPWRHLLNSNGIGRFPQYQAEMVRLGIGLYGIDDSGVLQPELRNVLTLKARIVQTRELPAGETVSYGRSGELHRPSRVATVSIGYADGLPRAAGYGRFAPFVHGKEAPLIGAVCMDLCMIDVTDIPEAREGDEVIIFGRAPRVETLAAAAGTIPYEILTGVAGRVRRVYLRE